MKRTINCSMYLFAITKNVIRYITFCIIFVGVGATAITAQNSNSTPTVREDLFAIKTADQFNAAYFNSSNSADKIAALSVLPMAIKKFNGNNLVDSLPWLRAILNDALSKTDRNVAQCAVEQIGIAKLISYADTLISMYVQTNSDLQDSKTIVLRMKIIKAIGNLAAPAASSVSFLKNIIDSHYVRPETDAAILAICQLCLADLVPNLHSYITDISNQINLKKFIMDDPKKKPLVPPEVSINIALNTIQSLGNGSCGK